MQYIFFSIALVAFLILGIGIGLLLPIFILKILNINIYHRREETKEPMAQEETKNITFDIINEWLNGKGGD